MIIFNKIKGLIEDINQFFYERKATKELSKINYFEDLGTHAHLPDNKEYDVSQYKLEIINADFENILEQYNKENK
jgi:hypothetical protein